MKLLGFVNHLSLRHKLFWLLFAPILIISLLSSLSFLTTRYHDLNENLLERSNNIAQQIALSSEYAIVFTDTNMMYRIMQSALSYDEVDSIQLFNNHQEVIAELGSTHINTEIEMPSTPSTLIYDDFLLNFTPIFYSNNSLDSIFNSQPETFDSNSQRSIIGWVRIETSKNKIRLQMYRYIAILTFLTILIGAGLILLAWRLSQYFTQPIDKLSNILDQIVKGNFSNAKLLSMPSQYKEIQHNILELSERLESHHEELISGIEQSTEDIRRSMDSMEEKSAQLHIANKEAMESNRLKSQFLANISHEVRTPLSAILGYTKILQSSNTDTQQRLYLETIEQSTNSLLAIIGDILDFSKIEAGKLNFENNHFNLKELVDEVYQTLSASLLTRDKQIDLVPDFQANVPDWVIGDSIRVRQILTNLIGNAIKFTHYGYVQTKVELVSQSADELVLSFQVIDTGIGIPEEKINNLFKPFSQVDTSTTRKFGGTGLGLVITKKLVEQMQGSIGIKSDQVSGSNFHFTLKMKPSRNTPAKQEALNLNLLMLEPSKSYQEYLTTYLDSIRVHCTTFNQIEPIINRLNKEQEKVDALLINISPNDHESIQDAKELVHFAKSTFGIPSILMIQKPEELARHPDLKQASQSILLKPISHNRLYQALDNIKHPASAPAIENKRSLPSKLQHLNILAVDDMAINLQLFNHWLSGNNLNVSLAYSGNEAIQMAKTTQYDIIFMDIQMPEKNGMETTQEIRQIDSYKNTPIIALTAHALGSEQQQILASGMNAYLTKPVDEEILLNTIEEWCSSNSGYLEQVDEKLLNIFDLNKALGMVNGRVDIAKDMFEMLANTLDDEQKLLQHHLTNQDTKKLIEVVHRIHGASKYTGTINIARHAGFLETHLKELGLEEVEGVFEDFIDAIQELLDNRKLIPWPQE